MIDTLPSLNDPDTRERYTNAAVKAIVRIARQWGLTEAQQLALLGESISRPKLSEWKREERSKRPLSRDQMERVSYLLGIYEGLERVFRNAPHEVERWMRRPRQEPPFDGVSPLDVMLARGIEGLAAVRRYVDGATGGPPSRSWHTIGAAREG